MTGPPRPAVETVLAGYSGQELLALADRRLDAERRHFDRLAALQADEFWSQVESDPDTNAAFARLTATVATMPDKGAGQRPRDAASPRRGETRAEAYARAALEGELSVLAHAAEGERNNTLVRSSFKLGQLVAGGRLDAGQVVAALTAVARGIGLADPEIAATVTSGLRNGMEHPR